MKKFIAIAALLFASSAFAQHGYHHHHHHGHRGGGNWVGPLIGGAIIGAIISEATRPSYPPVVVQTPPVYQYPPIIYQPNSYSCLVQVYDPVTRTTRNEVMVCTN